jgi:RimJ/RimL family protein N-acetyltransferase
MTTEKAPLVRLEPWAEDGLDLLRRTNAPEMTDHLGGPESEEQLISRHERYLDLRGKGQMFRVVLLPEGDVVGSTGYWERVWQDEVVYETGYGILPEFQGRGLAVAATVAVVEEAAAQAKHRYLHAFPSVDHVASNAVCQKAGFEFVAECEFEYPKGTFIRSNDWRADLA